MKKSKIYINKPMEVEAVQWFEHGDHEEAREMQGQYGYLQ